MREAVARVWRPRVQGIVVLAGRLGAGGAVCSKAPPRADPPVPAVVVEAAVVRVQGSAVEEMGMVGAPV